jgi:hypothetical protein
MNWKACVAGLCAAVIAGTALASLPAEAAAKKKKQRVVHNQPVVQRATTRVTVPVRSYLDPGTTLSPGESKQMDYALPPNYSPLGVLDNSSRYHRSPLPGPFDLPGRNNPWPFSW